MSITDETGVIFVSENYNKGFLILFKSQNSFVISTVLCKIGIYQRISTLIKIMDGIFFEKADILEIF